jgi:cellulase/cellobiase CelA1
MSAIISFMAQKMMGQGLGGMLSGGSSGGSGGIQSILSGLGGLNRDHELVKCVQQDAGIKDPETARQ